MLKNIVRKFKKPKFAKLSNGDKVRHLGEKAIGLFDHMKKAHTDLQNINYQLELVIDDEHSKLSFEMEMFDKKVKELQNNIERAHSEIGMNSKVQQKLEDFIVR